MANTQNAFTRLLSTIPKLNTQGVIMTGDRVLDYYSSLETQYQSEIFISKELLSRLEKVAETQEKYDLGVLKIKHIAKLVDMLYEAKHT